MTGVWEDHGKGGVSAAPARMIAAWCSSTLSLITSTDEPNLFLRCNAPIASSAYPNAACSSPCPHLHSHAPDASTTCTTCTDLQWRIAANAKDAGACRADHARRAITSR